MGGALQSDSAFSPSKFVKQRRIPGNEASSADKLLGSLYGRFSWVTSAPNTRKPYAIYMSPLTALPVSPSLELSLLILNVFSRTPTFAHSANESRFCSSLKFHPSLHRQLVYASQSPTTCLPRVRKPSNSSPFSPSSRLMSIVGKATYTPRIHGFLSVFGASGEIQGGVDNGGGMKLEARLCPPFSALWASPRFEVSPKLLNESPSFQKGPYIVHNDDLGGWNDDDDECPSTSTTSCIRPSRSLCKFPSSVNVVAASNVEFNNELLTVTLLVDPVIDQRLMTPITLTTTTTSSSMKTQRRMKTPPRDDGLGGFDDDASTTSWVRPSQSFSKVPHVCGCCECGVQRRVVDGLIVGWPRW
ncbi:uncharacterized protein LACBIDRAFT_328354 [Laccaria bicolor S238N-H82]|uniref:Predicted protein n=1 Tax=Laccaria bicolor (strain S238N-H82 / ATCC MYA-4686) TaxID=486041 RepID=B0DEL8_LACBS|nr:uncharacterized protein LACBIDRAFT_328354 [Laccaria bicolor S238N-H82]EDR06959.1 predicted protein [Laccaria bicolor S238N-H82]|eukprot:XP_001882332.1 predicted protein [Laccaria bicolor S238N-H82]